MYYYLQYVHSLVFFSSLSVQLKILPTQTVFRAPPWVQVLNFPWLINFLAYISPQDFFYPWWTPKTSNLPYSFHSNSIWDRAMHRPGIHPHISFILPVVGTHSFCAADHTLAYHSYAHSHPHHALNSRSFSPRCWDSAYAPSPHSSFCTFHSQ